jgi:hypothetical protein
MKKLLLIALSIILWQCQTSKNVYKDLNIDGGWTQTDTQILTEELAAAITEMLNQMPQKADTLWIQELALNNAEEFENAYFLEQVTQLFSSNQSIVVLPWVAANRVGYDHLLLRGRLSGKQEKEGQNRIKVYTFHFSIVKGGTAERIGELKNEVKKYLRN